jgi:coenzyme F420-dependent glucose-6-phosphate dehydrogenase
LELNVSCDTDRDRALPDTRFWGALVSDDPRDHINAANHYIAKGFTHLVFHAPGPDQERFLRLYSKEVLPHLRADHPTEKAAGR